MDHLEEISHAPAARRFDVKMLAIRYALVLGLCASAAWTAVQVWTTP